MEIGKVIFKLIMCMLTVVIYAKGAVNPNGIQLFNAAEIQQFIWSEWKITEMYYGGVGWQECQDDSKDVYIQFLPDKIIYDGQEAEVSTYYNQFLAIEDENALFHEIKYKDLGFRGEYFLKLEPDIDIKYGTCAFYSFVFPSDTELIIISGRVLYRAEKTREIEIAGDNPLLHASSPNSMCYGAWEITGNVMKDENEKNKKYIGEVFTTSKELNSFNACRVFSVWDEEVYELAELIDTGQRK